MPHQMTGDQSLLKRINRMALVRLVKAEPGLSRVDLANRTGLTKTTVGMLVQELIDEGWLHQSAPAEVQGVGRRPLPLTLDADRIGLLGAEIGVDYLNVVACNLKGEVLQSRCVPYRHKEVGRTLKALAAMVARAHAELTGPGRRVLGLGLGVPGTIDVKDAVLRFAPNLGWHGVKIEQLLSSRLAEAGCGGLPVMAMNEAKASALSEYVFGAEPHGGPLVYLAIGVGLGGGIVLSERLFLGHDGIAGEVGHTILERGGPKCACGRRGCAETFVSQRAVSRELTGKDEPVLTIAELQARLAAGDRAALKAARKAGEYLGVLLQNLANVYNPAVMVLGGPLVQLGEPFVDAARKSMDANGGRYDFHRHSVRVCRFGIDACAIGAAGAVFQRFLHSVEAHPAPPRRRARLAAAG
ncbi:MAG TPA: ROK family transcriptional regulator [Anaeromyxobacter sp.]|nr:ROK family transcriptional regulator [Anaeromyxobacter sp.]